MSFYQFYQLSFDLIKSVSSNKRSFFVMKKYLNLSGLVIIVRNSHFS